VGLIQLSLAPLQQLQPGCAGVFHRRRSKVAPYEGDLWETLSPGLKPRAESSCPFGVENPLRNLTLMLMGSRRTAAEVSALSFLNPDPPATLSCSDCGPGGSGYVTANNLSVPIFGCTNHPVMSSTKFDVQYVAELARISLTPEEINTFQSQLGHVLEHVEKLNQLDLANVEPTAHSFPIYNVFREDRDQPSLPHDLALSNAPRQAHGLFIVTKVVE
jgi:aspartyl-tRNA(Asn)/glutamyl-tRNA(Gln) amidotransferase subunit C